MLQRLISESSQGIFKNLSDERLNSTLKENLIAALLCIKEAKALNRYSYKIFP